jgi:hypothetical protein
MNFLTRRNFIQSASFLGLLWPYHKLNACPDDFIQKGGEEIVAYFIRKIKSGNRNTVFRILKHKTAGIRWDRIYLGQDYYPSMIPLNIPDYVEICKRIQDYCLASHIYVKFDFYIDEIYRESNKGLVNKCAE